MSWYVSVFVLCSHIPSPELLLPVPPRCPCPARHRSTPSLRPRSCANDHWSLELFLPGRDNKQMINLKSLMINYFAFPNFHVTSIFKIFCTFSLLTAHFSILTVSFSILFFFCVTLIATLHSNVFFFHLLKRHSGY